jgi:hypothetical protein
MKKHVRTGCEWACIALCATLVACGQGGSGSGSGTTGVTSAPLRGATSSVTKLPSIIEQARDNTMSMQTQGLRARGAGLDAASNRIVHVSTAGEIEVLLHGFGPISESQIAEITALGATVSESLKLDAIPGMPPIGLVQAWVPAGALEDVASLPWVAAVTPPDYPEPDVTSEGVAFHHADTAQAQGIDGTGISVGVVSNGVANLASSQALGDLPGNCPGTPCVNVLSVGGGDEGTAMLEIVSDMAPGANLFFAGGSGSLVNHLNALNALVGAGVNVIAEDIPFDSEPAFQQGQVAAAGDAIASGGISMHSSAGNLGDQHAARVLAAGTGTGPDGVIFGAAPAGCNGFTPGNVVAIAPGNDTTFDITTGGNGGSVTLQWSEPRAIFPTAGQGGFTDLNLYLMDTALTQCIAASTSVQANGTGDTVEFVNVPANGSFKVVVDVQGTSSAVATPFLDLRMRGGFGDVATRAGSLNPDSNYTGLASSSAAAFASSGSLETYSGGGPVQLGSTTVCPGGAAGPCTGVAGGGPNNDAGPAPTWTAADGVAVTGVGSFPTPFFGTSAAAPHAAACDALVRQAQGAGATVTTVRNALVNTALDQGPVGADPAWGFGVLDCFKAAGGPTARCKDVHVSAGATCTAAVTPDMVNDGSSDPNGAALTFTLSPTGPFGLTPTTVTLTVSNGTLTDTCTAQVTVTDDTPPVLTVPPNVALNSCLSSTVVTVGNATATDNCVSPIAATGQVVATNGVNLPSPIPVVGGQVTLGIGMHTIRWTASDGPNTSIGYQMVTVGTSIQASQSFLVDDRGRVLSFGGGFGAMLNSGSGATRLGNDGRSGDVLSVGPITVQHRAVVNGSATSAGTIFKDSDGTITGASNQLTPVVLPGLPTLPSFPPPTAGNFTVNGGTVPKAPGSYTSGTVNGGTLVLSSGDYYFQSLTINASVTVRATATTRVFVQNTLVFRSSFRAPTGTAIQPVYLGYAGTAGVTLEAVFDGTLIAPNATISFGTGSGLTFTGSYYAKVLHVNPASALVCKAGGAVGTPPVPPVPPPPGNLSAVTQTTTDFGSGYCVVLDVSNPMATAVSGFTVNLNTNGASIYASWNGTFSGSSGPITIHPAFAWNQGIAAHGLNSSVGFCVNRTVPGSGTLPIMLGASSP